MTRGARAARGAAIAVFATFVASLAHAVGGGAVPGPVAVLVALAFSAPLAMLLAGARARLLRTSISALVAQATLHLCYALGGASTAGGHDAGGRSRPRPHADRARARRGCHGRRARRGRRRVRRHPAVRPHIRAAAHH